MTALVIASLLAADTPPVTKVGFAPRASFRGCVGIGNVALVHGAFAVTDLEWNLRPFRGALQAGTSASFWQDMDLRWTGGAWGLYFAIDLIYLLLSGFWWVEPSPTFPVRLTLGARIGMGVTRSWLPRPELPAPPAYLLARPEIHSWADLEVVLPGTARQLSVFARGAIDTPVSLATVFRWAFSIGIAWGYDP